MKLKNSCLEQFFRDMGIDSIGFTKMRKFNDSINFYVNRINKGYQNEFEEECIENRINPFIYMEDGKTIITVAFPYNFDKKAVGDFYFSKYTWGIDYHYVARMFLQKAVNFIEDQGGKAKAFVDSNALPERYLAQLSGIGYIGKNSLLFTEKYGSYVFLGEIITDIEFEETEPLENACGNCNKCIVACPTGALQADGCNSNRCLSYMTQKKHLEDEWLLKFQGRLFGCDTCQIVCPNNKDVEYSSIEYFKPLEFMYNPNLFDIIYMNNKSFNDSIKRTSAGWRGKSILQRNALLCSKKLVPEKINSAYVLQYYNRLLKIL